ncbi:MAG: hypothetical protein IT430_03075 [Phycisphaerales bacterium]|nr:hypothetical protein [Phycisphaerales bacterium]
MLAYLIGTAIPWLGLFGWMWYAEWEGERYWIESVWNVPRLEYYDVPWILTLLVLVPIVTAWSGMELMRLWRRPRLFDRRIGGWCGKRAALGLIAGLAGVALFGLATTYQPETHLPDVANVLGSIALATASLGLLLPRIRPGCCIVCNYDTRHLPFPQPPGLRRCPECGAEVA